MSKRRRPTRRRNQPSASQPIYTGSIRLLQRAHKMMEIGRHTDAARILEGLARQAEDRGRMRVAPNLYLLAGRANILATETPLGTEQIQHGLSILKIEERWSALARASHRVLWELERMGYLEIREGILAWTNTALPKPIASYLATDDNDENGVRLPIKCQICGGGLHPGEIQILDEANAECPYCGVTIKGFNPAS